MAPKTNKKSQNGAKNVVSESSDDLISDNSESLEETMLDDLNQFKCKSDSD